MVADGSTKRDSRSISVLLAMKGAIRPWLCPEDVRLTVVLPDEAQADDFLSDALALRPDGLFFRLSDPALEKRDVNDLIEPSVRGHVLRQWSRTRGILVATPGGILSPYAGGRSSLELVVGRDVGRERLVLWLDERGYRRVDLVWRPGEYAVRGGVVDLFDPSSKMPYRIAFFDEEVEDIRLFSPGDQTTRYRSETVTVWGLENRDFQSVASMIVENGPVYIFDPRRCQSNADGFRWIWNNLSDRCSIPEDRWDRFLMDAPQVVRFEPVVTLRQERPGVVEPPRFRGRIEDLEAQVSLWIDEGYHISIRSTSPPPRSLQKLDWAPSPVTGGFVDLRRKRVVLSDMELYGLRPDRRTDRANTPRDWSLAFDEGQWLVHQEHGLCRYGGLELIGGDWGSQEFLALLFHDEKRLLLPVTQLAKISSYQGSVDESTSADRLGSKRWRTALKKAEHQVEEEARELLNLYARKAVAQGRSFSSDGEAMRTFEAHFPHMETRDQLQAIQDVKRDMESSHPMDRLIVGDVGYGKTEVALRAAFKAVMDGTQVLVLVPTTVLAQQHYLTFKSRMAPFPVRVELLSRFVSPSKQEETLLALADGRVDVVIGTHRLLQQGLAVRDLGLIVIDEEHRFGVAHKERFRELSIGVDILTLSATPIPRTMSMALRGMRDISVIETAPGNRPPVVTVTGPWSDDLVRSVVARELARGGQTYFIHNRVTSILERAEWVQSRFPDAVVAVAHGKMGERELEETMMAFYEGTVNILICTTIVESGLDVGRANTLIVDDSRTLGLAQMHQIRGRVGRREETAYALFLYPQNQPIPRSTEERLEAIGRLSFQGAGYELARQDLQIRGGGDLLGMTQHGHRERIGLQLYYTKLQERIRELRGEALPKLTVDIQMPLAIPESYVPQSSVRLSLYRRLDQVATVADGEDLRREFQDRFGPLPPTVRALVDLAVIRTEGGKHGIIHGVVSEERWELTVDRTSSISLPLPWRRIGRRWIGPGGTKGIESLFQTCLKTPAQNGKE